MPRRHLTKTTLRGRPTAAPVEILIGRSLAAIVHPVAAWQVFPARDRLLLVLGYSVVAYIAVLSALLLRGAVT